MATVTDSTTPTYDYSMIGSVGGEAAQSVNGDMINKIRAAEEKSVINPITEDIDNIALETDKLTEIKSKITEFQDMVSYFDLNNDENVFNQYLFDSTGSSAVFDAVNMSNLKEGTTTVDVTQIPQRDVFQTEKISGAGITGDSTISAGQTIGDNIKIAIGSTEYEFNAYKLSSDGTSIESAKSYKELAAEISLKDELQASVEAVGTDVNGNTEYRLIIKSAESGIDNSLTITYNHDDTVIDSGADETGFNSLFGDLSNGGVNNVLEAKNFKATIDNVEYDMSSDSITTQGSIKITGLELGKSSITVSKDTSAVVVAAEAMVAGYTALHEMINEEIYSTEAGVEDKNMLRDVLSDLKNMFFSSYGAETPEFGTETDKYGDIVKAHSNVTNNDKNLFVFGFGFDKSGNLTLDTEIFKEIVSGESDDYNFDDLKNVFTGSYENKGVGIQIKEYLDALDGYDGTFYNYEIDMIDKKADLEKDKETELKRLDAKYDIMAQQFGAYSGLIAQMESQFNGLKMMIEQSTSGN